jgi:CBS domain containing-hemolysin-like protein
MIIKVFSNSTFLVLLSQSGRLKAVILGSLIILLFCELLPRLILRSKFITITAKITPVLRQAYIILSPVTKLVQKMQSRYSKTINTVDNRDDLIQTIESVGHSKDSGLSAQQVKLLKSVLEFDEKKVRDIMTPRRMVQVVVKEDQVGPVLMDELHKSGNSRFPVVSEAKHMNFVGTLYLRDLVGETGSKHVKELMSPQVFYIHEEESLAHALRAFLNTHHHLFVVVNNFEEFVGVLSIEDVLEEIIGKEIVDEFDQYDNLRAVALSLAEKDQTSREKDADTKEK